MPPFSSFSLLQLCLAILILSLFIINVDAQHLNLSALNSSHFMQLSLGLNLSILASYSLPSGHPLSKDRIFAVGIPNVDDGLFFPILSSPFFNDSSQAAPPGFSFGLYGSPCNSNVCTLYLAVCAGFSGNTDSKALLLSDSAFFPLSTPGINIHPYYTKNGFVVPLWMANGDSPINNAGDASLVVVATHSTNIVQELQLRDGNQVVWNVRNASKMEMSDSGDLIIYDSANVPVFQLAQSTVTDTLLEGQRMTVGMELTSSNSAYTARMEKGGLALFMNEMGGHLPPYWIFPFLRDPGGPLQSQRSPSMNELISSAPCSNASYLGYLQIVTANNEISLDFSVEPKSCRYNFSNQYFYHYPTDLQVTAKLAWSFLRLEFDGRLYIYSITKAYLHNPLVRGSVDIQFPTLQTFIRLPDSGDNLEVAKPTSMITKSMLQLEDGQSFVPFCDVPLACGPLCVCKPASKAPVPCLCPDESSFEPIDTVDLSQGCQPRTSLPLCNGGAPTSTHSNHTTFLELKSMASVFLFNEWTLNSTQDVDTCKQACASDCSCLGVSYQVSTSFCFLIQHNISLVTVLDANITIWNYTATTIDHVALTKQIYADDYVTHLKVVNSLMPPPPGFSIEPTVKAQNPSAFPLMSLVGIIPLCVLFLGLGVYGLTKRRRKLLQEAKEEEELRDILPILPSRFSYKQLKEATKSFSKLLGAGGCGSVYEGILLDGRKVAVKVLEGVLQGARQSKEFLAEVATVGRTGHHNIVRLVGFCWQASHRILVYEYMERGSLDRWLFSGVEGDMSLNWHRRYDITLGIARGLQYLHEECEQSILHFDLKPQNVLLDDAFAAKISDFGMSRLLQRDMSSVMTGLRGTPGYIAPEWLFHATVSKKTDVYSMGIVMLEIVAGRRVLDYSLFSSSSSGMDSSQEETWHLPSWAVKKLDQGMLMDIMDKRLYLSGFDEVQVQRLLYIAFWCIHEDPAMRPHAATVVQWLENIDLPIEQPPSTTAMNSTMKEHVQAALKSSSSMS